MSMLKPKNGVNATQRLTSALSNMPGLPGMVASQALSNRPRVSQNPPQFNPNESNASIPMGPAGAAVRGGVQAMRQSMGGGGYPTAPPAAGTSPQALQGRNRLAQGQLGLAQNALTSAQRDTQQLRDQNQQNLGQLNATAGQTGGNYGNFKALTGGNANDYRNLAGDQVWFGQGQRPENYSPGEQGNIAHGQMMRGAPITQSMPAGPEVDPEKQQQVKQALGIPGEGVELTDEQVAAQEARDQRAKTESNARLAKGKDYKAKRLDQEMDRRLAQQEERNQRKADRAKDRTTGRDTGTHSDQRYQDERFEQRQDKATDRQHGLMDHQAALTKSLQDDQQEFELQKTALTRSAQSGDPNALKALTNMRKDKIDRLDSKISDLQKAQAGLRNEHTGEITDQDAYDKYEAEIDKYESEVELESKQQQRTVYRHMVEAGQVDRADVTGAPYWKQAVQDPKNHPVLIAQLNSRNAGLDPNAQYTPEDLIQVYMELLDAQYQSPGITQFLMDQR